MEWILQSEKGSFVLIALMRNRRNISVPKRPQYVGETHFSSDWLQHLSFDKPSSLSWGYEWLNWQRRGKCQMKCQQWKRGYWTNSPVWWQCQEGVSIRRSECREQSGFISCHHRHIITFGGRTWSSSLVGEYWVYALTWVQAAIT